MGSGYPVPTKEQHHALETAAKTFAEQNKQRNIDDATTATTPRVEHRSSTRPTVLRWFIFGLSASITSRVTGFAKDRPSDTVAFSAKRAKLQNSTQAHSCRLLPRARESQFLNPSSLPPLPPSLPTIQNITELRALLPHTSSHVLIDIITRFPVH